MKNIPGTIKIFDLLLFIKSKNKNWKTSVFSNFGVGGMESQLPWMEVGIFPYYPEKEKIK